MRMIMRNSSIVKTRESYIYKKPAETVIPEEQDIVILIGSITHHLVITPGPAPGAWQLPC